MAYFMKCRAAYIDISVRCLLKFSVKTNHHEDKKMDDVCLSFRFDLATNVIFKIEGHKLKGLMDEVLKMDNPGIDYDDSSADWYMFASKITLSF